MNVAAVNWDRRSPDNWATVVHSPISGVVRLTAYALWTLMLIPIQAMLIALGLRWRFQLPRLYHAVCARVIGIDIHVVGVPERSSPVMFVSNHSSYLDIMVLGAVIPASFVAKAEVARWPFFGLLAKLQQTVFVDRGRRREVGDQRTVMARRLEAGDNLVLFAEGTSSDGNRVYPFKSALFSVVEALPEASDLRVQPVSVTATALDGIPLGRAFRPLYAWYGDMGLAPHLWRFVQAGRVTVRVEFHPAVTADRMATRKALTAHCWQQVTSGVARALAGVSRDTGSLVDPAGDDPVSAPGAAAETGL